MSFGQPLMFTHDKFAMTAHVNNSWYVTFEMPKTMKLRGWRTPRTTKTFQNELEAKEFARIKYAEGLKINVGTINPHLPKRAIAWRDVHHWLDETRKQETDDPGACNR